MLLVTRGMPFEGPVMAESLRSSPHTFASPPVSSNYSFETMKRDSNASKRRSPPAVTSSTQSLGSAGSADFQDATSDMPARTGSIADSDYQDAASEGMPNRWGLALTWALTPDILGLLRLCLGHCSECGQLYGCLLGGRRGRLSRSW